MSDLCNWPVGNGKILSFEIYSRNDGWNKVPGIFSRFFLFCVDKHRTRAIVRLYSTYI